MPTEQKSQGGQVFAIETRKVNTAPQNPTLDVPESSLRGANKKNKGKPYCYRCHTKGHTIATCTTVLSCEICLGDHVKKICPNLKIL